MKTWLPWTITALLAAILIYNYWFSGPMTVSEAAAKNMVGVAVGGFDERSDSVSVTLSRGSASGEVIAVLPAGTVLNNGDERGQRLMTARTVTLVIAEGAPSTTARIEVYCLDQFSLRPTPTSMLSLPSVGDEGVTEETEPVRQLTECLQKTSAALRVRQLAIWLVGGSYLDQDYDVARERLIDSYRETMATQAEARRGDFEERIRRKLPNVSRARVDALIESFRARSAAAAIENQARADADKVLRGFRESLSVVEPCIDGFSSKAFVASVPPV
jgi:hypothetical protein